jgi:hypothetical protein
MVVCSCRGIKESHYDNKEDLIARVLEDDHCCGKCLEEFLPNCNEKQLTPTTNSCINNVIS